MKIASAQILIAQSMNIMDRVRVSHDFKKMTHLNFVFYSFFVNWED
ncbi:hypothetical protein QG37_04749 [Candidozyma auris]|uniref:Uncharacterized protein n=1 Tax=Candidozyma auris TaxID=498019 RepID=A0A0L0NWJ2_CANAR|nr:hypothetical protein QG37_04749 [[Candida] auris]